MTLLAEHTHRYPSFKPLLNNLNIEHYCHGIIEGKIYIRAAVVGVTNAELTDGHMDATTFVHEAFKLV